MKSQLFHPVGVVALVLLGLFMTPSSVFAQDVPTPDSTVAVEQPVPQEAAVATEAPEAMSIAETIQTDERFSQAAAALEAADLLETLTTEGPFTVFVPTNEAFAKLDEGTLDTLLAPENKEALIDLLTYHLVAGEVTADELAGREDVTTVQGAPVDVVASEDGVMVGEATVAEEDVAASNGVIYVIDTVLMPPTVPAPSAQ